MRVNLRFRDFTVAQVINLPSLYLELLIHHLTQRKMANPLQPQHGPAHSNVALARLDLQPGITVVSAVEVMTVVHIDAGRLNFFRRPIAMGPIKIDQRIVLGRSEEHTSELQSRENLVCRLLLEKKN